MTCCRAQLHAQQVVSNGLEAHTLCVAELERCLKMMIYSKLIHLKSAGRNYGFCMTHQHILCQLMNFGLTFF